MSKQKILKVLLLDLLQNMHNMDRRTILSYRRTINRIIGELDNE